MESRIYEDTNFFYIVQEYCGGGELLQRIVKTKQLDQKVAALIIKKIMSAVSMHLKGVAQRPQARKRALRHKGRKLRNQNHRLRSLQQVLQQTDLAMVGTPLYVSPVGKNYF